MKAYITCPVSHTKKRLSILPKIKSIVEKKEIETFVFEIGGSPKEIFERDYNQLKNSDILIAEVSETSHGVGIEIGISLSLNKKIILLVEKGKYVTPLAQGIPDIKIIEYQDETELEVQLSQELKNLSR